MLLKDIGSKHLVEVLDLAALADPFRDRIKGRFNIGEDLPEPDEFLKSALCFPSGERLPRCWTDAHYRDQQIRH